MSFNFKPQTIVQLKNEKNKYIQSNHFEEDIFNSKIKKTIMSFNDLKVSIPSATNRDIKLLAPIIVITFSFYSFLLIYCEFIKNLSIFGKHFFLDFIVTVCGAALTFSSSYLFGKFFHNMKFFKYQREEEEARAFSSKFKNLDTSHIISDIQRTLYQELESKNIEKSNHYLHSYLKESILRLEGDFNKLNYELELQERKENYSFDSFRTFLNTCSILSENIKKVDSIKVISD